MHEKVLAAPPTSLITNVDGVRTLHATVEESRALRQRRLQSRFRDRGGVFVPSENNLLLPLLLARGVNGESPGAEKRTRTRSQPSKCTIKTEAPSQESDTETTKLARSKALEKKRAKKRIPETVQDSSQHGIDPAKSIQTRHIAKSHDITQQVERAEPHKPKVPEPQVKATTRKDYPQAELSTTDSIAPTPSRSKKLSVLSKKHTKTCHKDVQPRNLVTTDLETSSKAKSGRGRSRVVIDSTEWETDCEKLTISEKENSSSCGGKKIKKSGNEDSNANPLSKPRVSSRQVGTRTNTRDKKVAEAAHHVTYCDSSKKARTQADPYASASSQQETKNSSKQIAADHGSRPHGSVPSVRASRKCAKSKNYAEVEDDDDELPVVTRKTKKRLSAVNEVREPPSPVAPIQHKGNRASRDQRGQKVIFLSAKSSGEEDIPGSKTKATDTPKKITVEASKTRIRKKVPNTEEVVPSKARENSFQTTKDFLINPPRRIAKSRIQMESEAEEPHTKMEGLDTTHAHPKSHARSAKRRRQKDDIGTPEVAPLPLKRRKSTDDAVHDVFSPLHKSGSEERKFIEPTSKNADKERVDDPPEKRERPVSGNTKNRNSNSVKGARTSSGKAKENTAVIKIKKQPKKTVTLRMGAESHLDYDSGPDPLDLLS